MDTRLTSWTLPAGVALVSAAALALEVTYTRLFSLVYWHHFAVVAVGIGLLGFGASGTALAVAPSLAGRTAEACAGAAAAAVVAYLGLVLIPFDPYRMALEPVQAVSLSAQLGLLVLPFLCAGLAVGAALAQRPGRAGRIYAASLLGSAAGALGAVGLLWVLPAPNVVLACAAVASAAAAVLLRARPGWRAGIGIAAAALMAVAVGVDLPLRLSPYKALSVYRQFPDARVIVTRWTPLGRLDVVRSSAFHPAAGLSTTYTGPVPPSPALLIDGDQPRPLVAASDAAYADFLPQAVAFALRDPSARRVLVVSAGGPEAALAVRREARLVVADPDPAVRDIARAVAPDVYGAAEMVGEDARAYLRRSGDRFDVIILPLRESFQVVAAGTFSLAETYAYTVEAFVEWIQALRPEGLLVATRWVQQPPSEETRLWATAVAALERLGLRPSDHLAALRSLNTLTVVVSRSPWTPRDAARLLAFARARRFDLPYAPGAGPAEANRYHVLGRDVYREAFLALLDPRTRQEAYARSAFDIRPVRDGRPFFFHFFRWRQTAEVLAALGRTWQPFGGSGYLVLVAALAVAVLLSAGMILIPLRRLGPVPPGASATLTYFLALGVGYLAVEIPLLHQVILLLDHPTYALAVVLAGMLAASGIGSLASTRVAGRLPVVVGVVALLAAGAAGGMGPLTRAALQGPWAGRVGTAAAVAVALGVPMGVPFAAGIARLRRQPGLVPWAWGVNGFASVVASMGSAVAMLQWGYEAVQAGGALAYLIAGALAARLDSPSPSVPTASGTRGRG
ncbi:MAG: hypothetical protein QN146_01505 [Armatimonadota bacterium]|nr:hypothetical protein [Armatimonadota bacterium]